MSDTHALQQAINVNQRGNLALITSCQLAALILTALRDFALLGTDSLVIISVNVGLIVLAGAITLAAIGKRIPVGYSQLAATLCMACIGVKPALAAFYSEQALPLYLAIVLLASALTVLSWRHLISVMAWAILLWAVAAATRFTVQVLIINALIAIFAGVLALVIHNQRIAVIRQLHRMAERIKSLESVLSMCANCKKTRDAEGNWLPLEEYLHRSANKLVSHGICPECKVELYGDLYAEDGSRKPQGA